MRIICPTCASHYELDAGQIGANGQLVRCAACREVWLVRRSDETPRPTRTPSHARPPRPERDPEAFAAAAAAGAASRPASEPERSGRDPIDFAEARSRLRRPDSGMAARRRGGSAGTLLSVAAACAAMAGVLVGFRGAIASRLPAAAPAFAAIGLPVLPDGLALQDVRSVVRAEGGHTVLDLEGRIANLHGQSVAVPDLNVMVRDARATPLYTWQAAAPKPSLAGGETVAFRTRLSAPPTGGRDVRVSFADASTASR